MKPLIPVLVLMLGASLALAQGHEGHDHGPGDGHGHEAGAAPPSPASNLPPPGPEEKAALEKIGAVKQKKPQSEAEERKLRSEYAEALTAFVTGFPESPRAAFALEAVLKLLVGSGDPAKAETVAKTFLEKTQKPEGKAMARRQLLQVYKFGGQPDKAVTFALEQATANKDAPDAEWYVYEAASMRGEQGQHDAAIKILEDFVAANPKHPSVNKFRLRVSDFLVSAGRAKEAIPKLDALVKAATVGDERSIATYFLGVAYLAASRQAAGEEAASLRKKALEVGEPLLAASRKDPAAGKPYGAMAFTTAADVALAAGDVTGATKVYDEMAKIFKDTPEGGYAERARLDVTFIGTPLADVEGPSTEDKPVKSTDFKGKILLVDFFSATHGAYPQTLAQEKKLAKKLAGQPFAILGVNLDRKELADPVKKFVKSVGITWPVIYDGSGSEGPMARLHNITAMPANFVVDENGIVMRVGLFGPHLEDLVTQETARVAKGLPSNFKAVAPASPAAASPVAASPAAASPAAASPAPASPAPASPAVAPAGQ